MRKEGEGGVCVRTVVGVGGIEEGRCDRRVGVGEEEGRRTTEVETCRCWMWRKKDYYGKLEGDDGGGRRLWWTRGRWKLECVPWVVNWQ